MPEPAPHNRPFPTGAFEPYVPAVVPPDPERDKRVAARRAADAARAARALDDLLSPYAAAAYRAGYDNGWSDGHAACELHHNRHYAPFHGTRGLTDERPCD